MLQPWDWRVRISPLQRTFTSLPHERQNPGRRCQAKRSEGLADDKGELLLWSREVKAGALDVPLVAPGAAPAVLDQPVRLHSSILVLLMAVAHLRSRGQVLHILLRLASHYERSCCS